MEYTNLQYSEVSMFNPLYFYSYYELNYLILMKSLNHLDVNIHGTQIFQNLPSVIS